MAQSDISPTGLMGDAWALYRSDFFVLTAVPFLGNLLIEALSLILAASGASVTIGFNLIFGPVIAAIVIVLARDAEQQRRVPFPDTLAVVMPHFSRLVILSVIAAILAALGLFLLIVPGLYITAVLMIHVPLILFKDAGWQALQRSFELSKPHAWQLVLVLLMLVVIVFVLIGIGGAIVGALQTAIDAPLIWTAVLGFLSAILTGGYACLVYVTYQTIFGDGDNVDEVFQ